MFNDMTLWEIQNWEKYRKTVYMRDYLERISICWTTRWRHGRWWTGGRETKRLRYGMWAEEDGGEEGGLGSLGCLASPGNPYIRWQTIPGTPCWNKFPCGQTFNISVRKHFTCLASWVIYWAYSNPLLSITQLLVAPQGKIPGQHGPYLIWLLLRPSPACRCTGFIIWNFMTFMT